MCASAWNVLLPTLKISQWTNYEYKGSLSHAAIRKLFPAAISQDEPGGRISVKPTDRYSATVQVLTIEGALSVRSRGSRERELAGRHRATVMRVLRGQESQSALEQYRGKTVGGHELVSDFDLLSTFAQAGIVGQLDSLYVSPDASA